MCDFGLQTVVGTDIAELLMCNRSSHVTRQQPPSSVPDVGVQSNMSEEEITNQFRDYLIYGNTKEALGDFFAFLLLEIVLLDRLLKLSIYI